MFFSIPHSPMGDQLLNLASSRKRSLLKPSSPDPSSFSVDLEIRSCSSPDTDIFSAISFILHSSYVKPKPSYYYSVSNIQPLLPPPHSVFKDLLLRVRGPKIPFPIPNWIGVESTLRWIKIHFLCHCELWQVVFVRVLHLRNVYCINISDINIIDK